MQKKGFIAAPLIGTLIFLISILTIINLSRAEATAVSEVVSEAYHNKLVSIVEIYRSDMGSIFNIGLQRNIEYALTSQCWGNFLSLKSYQPDTGQSVQYNDILLKMDGDSDGFVDDKEERKFYCARTSNIIMQTVCSSSNYLFGLPKLAEILTNDTSFEGIDLKAANKEVFIKFTQQTTDLNPEAAVLEGFQLCAQLLKTLEIDCNEFAEKRFKCCSEFENGLCKTEGPDCSSGNQFYFRITVLTPEIYGKFPRVLAEDAAGNKIRAGAITESDFDAPVSYPIFRYMDAAFEFNKYIAFGKNKVYDPAGGDVGADRGVVEGSCVGENSGFPISEGCSVSEAGAFNLGVDYGPPAFNSDLPAIDAIAEGFLGRVAQACNYAESKNLKTQFELRAPNAEWVDCAALPSRKANVILSYNINDESCPGSTGKFCAAQRNLGDRADIKFLDPDPAMQIAPDKQNELCWSSGPEFIPISP